MRALVIVALTILLTSSTAHAGGHLHALHKKIHDHHQAHAHKKKMKKAMDDCCKEHHHHLLHHHKGGH